MWVVRRKTAVFLHFFRFFFSFSKLSKTNFCVSHEINREESAERSYGAIFHVYQVVLTL